MAGVVGLDQVVVVTVSQYRGHFGVNVMRGPEVLEEPKGKAGFKEKPVEGRAN